MTDRVADASLKPAQHRRVPWSLVQRSSTKAGSEPVGHHAQGMTEGSTHFYLSLLFERMSGLSFHDLFPLDPVL